jgi:hypothetical protein
VIGVAGRETEQTRTSIGVDFADAGLEAGVGRILAAVEE